MRIRGKAIRAVWLVVVGVVAIAGIAVLAFRSGVPAIGQSVSIAYVDMQRALDGHPRRAASERALQEFFQAKQREFEQRSRGLNAVQRQELDRRLQQEFLAKREELFSGLDKDIRAAVEKVATDRGVGLVLDRTVVLYGGTDLTDPVVAQLTGK